MSKFAVRLKELRLDAKMTTRQLAEEIGVSHVSIVRWEKEEVSPVLDYVIKIAQFFHVSLDYLCGLID